MSDRFTSELISTDLPITLYLNQRLTFDVLAVLEGGFSHFSTVHTTSSDQSSTNISADAGLGFSNVFSLLGVKLSTRGSRQTDENLSESATEEIVHTPASLFARLRKDLHERELVRDVSSLSTLDSVSPGNFVEFEATLRGVPLVERLSAFSEFMSLAELTEVATDNAQTERRGGKRRSRSQQGQQQNNPKYIKHQIDLMLSAVTGEGSQDLIAEVSEIRVVLTTEREYFIDPSMNDIIDGTFRVFGKATRIITDDSEGVNLLRKTSLGKVGSLIGGVIKQLDSAMSSMDVSGSSSRIESQIDGPAMQVIPIAIFS